MKTYNVIFTALTRDNMEHLPRLIEDLAAMGTTLFRSFAFVISENDSVDGTKEYLQRLQENSSSSFPVTRVGEDFHNEKRPSTSFLAKMRNFYLREIYDNPIYDNYDYMIVFDTDFEREKFVKPEGLINSFNRTEEKWDVLAANGERWEKMWDAFAFRNDEFDLPYVPENFPQGIGSYWPTILHLQRKYEDGPLIPVKSAFGGLTIYKLSMLRGLYHNESSEDCEHVSLHSQIMSRGGRIFMNPNMRLTFF